MTKTLKLDDKSALKIYKTADKELKEILENSFGKEFFLQNIKDRIKDLSDICNILEVSEEEIIIFKKPSSDFERYINACSIIPRIVEVYNEGTILDWSNSNQYKYLPYYKKVSGCGVFDSYYIWTYDSNGSAAHHYKSSDLLQDACKKFDKYYKDFFSFNG